MIIKFVDSTDKDVLVFDFDTKTVTIVPSEQAENFKCDATAKITRHEDNKLLNKAYDEDWKVEDI